MVKEEQKELKQVFSFGDKKSQEKTHDTVMLRCHERSHELLKIINKIKYPSIRAVGVQGSEAVLTLAMHSYLDVMEKIVAIFDNLVLENPESVSLQYLPALKDRIHVIKYGRQLYGTQWTLGEDKTPFMIEVDEPDQLEARRKKYNMMPLVQPRNLTNNGKKYTNEGLVITSIGEVSRPMSAKEHGSYIKYYEKSLIVNGQHE